MSLSLSERALARRYARAYFDLEGPAAAARAAEELRGAAGALDGRTGALRDPRLSLEDRKLLLRRELGSRASARILRLLDLLVEEKRLELVGAISRDFSSLCDEASGILRASVRSAADLPPEQAEALKARLDRFFGKDVRLDVRVDPGLIAGVAVHAGDWVLDASFQGELRRLREGLAG